MKAIESLNEQDRATLAQALLPVIDRLFPRPQSAAIQGGQVLFDPTDIVGGGANMSYWPLASRIYDIVGGDDLASDDGVLNSECAELLGYAKVPVSPSGEAWAVVLDMDTRIISSMLFGDAKALMNSKPGRVKLFIDKWGETLNSTLDIVHLDQAVGANMFGNGRTMDGWDAIPVPINAGDGYVPTAGGYLTGLGFERSWRSGVPGGQVLMGWRSRQVRMRGESGFVRMYAGLDAVQNLAGATMKVHLFGDSGVFINTQEVRCERKLSDYEWVFAGRFDIPVATREIRVGFDAGVTGNAHGALTGEQIHVGPKRVYTILRDDYPACDASRRFVYSRHMFMTKGRPKPLYVPQIAQRKTDVLDLTATFWAAGGAAGSEPTGDLPYEVQGDRIIIEPSRINSTTGGIDLHPHDWSVRRLRVPLALCIAPPFGTGTVRPLFIGDSITDDQHPKRVSKKLEGIGYTVNCIGTIRNNGGGTLTAPAYGGEGRRGIEWADYTYERTDFAAPLPVGQESAYLAMTDEQKRGYNPFLRAAIAGDNAAYVFNGYIWDLRFYLNRFGYVDPTHIIINLGRNDITERTSEVAMGQMQRGFAVLYNQSRAACPSAQIQFVTGGEGRTKAADREWDTDRWPMTLAMRAQIIAKQDGGDSKLWDVSAFAHTSGETGWGLVLASTDPETGMQVFSVSDSTHMDPVPNDIARSQHAEAVADCIHYTMQPAADAVLTGRETSYAFGGSAGGGLSWTLPNTVDPTFLLGSTRHILQLDLRRFKQARLVVNRQATTGAASSKLAVRYIATNSFTIANYSSLGVLPIEVAIPGSVGLVRSAWFDLAPGAKIADALVAIVGLGGDGATAAQFGSIILELR